jgi:hypothetical protein
MCIQCRKYMQRKNTMNNADARGDQDNPDVIVIGSH